MIPIDRYPKEITLRDDARVILRPMVPGDADGLWSFLRQLPEIDKSHFHEDVDRREVVEGWAKSLDYDAALPILAIRGKRVVGSATLYRNKTGWKQRVGIVRILISPDHRRLGLGTAMIREIRHLGEKVALNYLLAEVIEEQQSAVRALERMGFEKAVVHRDFVNDRKGHLHNLVVLLHPLSGLEKGMFY
jgi:RimJ/RimL family protein N-acetyltransferase